MTAFLNDHIRVKRKRRTATLFEGYIRNHIPPAIGSRKAPSLTRGTIEQLHRSVGREHPVTANRLVALIGAAYEYGISLWYSASWHTESGSANRKIPRRASRTLLDGDRATEARRSDPRS
jgi:hypothetical protein